MGGLARSWLRIAAVVAGLALACVPLTTEREIALFEALRVAGGLA